MSEHNSLSPQIYVALMLIKNMCTFNKVDHEMYKHRLQYFLYDQLVSYTKEERIYIDTLLDIIEEGVKN